MKIAFYPMGGIEWFAGVSWLKSLTYALKYTYGNSVQWYFIYHKPHPAIASKEVPVANNTILIPYLRRRNPAWMCDRLARRLLMRNLHEEIVLKRNGVDLIFGSILKYQYGIIPTLSWIYDFQHVHMPEMFPSKECRERDRLFAKTSQLASRIVVKSESAKRDFQKFLPQYQQKVRVIKFNNYIPESIYGADLSSVVALYNLPEKFIYLPNQFWKHKNHERVFSTIKKLKEKGLEMCVVCSGFVHDYRNPNHCVDLFRKISEWGLRDQIIYLGMIPHEHVLLLMRQSICVLNPSLFEGFGMSVNEAGVLGKQILLSDIPAHREQSFVKMTFFDPHSLDDLESKIISIWRNAHPGPDLELEEKARKEMPGKIKECAQSFIAIVKELIS